MSHNDDNLFINKTKSILAKTAITFIAVPPFAASCCLGYDSVVRIINGYHHGKLPYHISYPMTEYCFNFIGLSLSTLGICFVGGHYLYFYNNISKYL
jgi:hypothetical protein